MKNFTTGMAGLVMAGLVLWGCGGGGGDSGPQPLGLFDQSAENSVNDNVSTTADTSEDALIVSELALGDSGAAGTAGKSLSNNSISFPSLPRFSVLNGVGKSLESDATSNCTQTGTLTYECSGSVGGPAGGSVSLSALFNFEEDTDARTKGSVRLQWVFDNFTFSQNACQRDIQLKGGFDCSLDFDNQITTSDLLVAASGNCNTVQSLGQTIQTWIGGQEHHVGYDLVLDYNESMPLAEAKSVFLADMNVDGTVSFDGTAHPYKKLKSLLTNRCK